MLIKGISISFNFIMCGLHWNGVRVLSEWVTVVIRRVFIGHGKCIQCMSYSLSYWYFDNNL